MISTEFITLKVPRTETEYLFLQRVVQAAIQAYRNGQYANNDTKRAANATESN
jgi:hypothetical protein